MKKLILGIALTLLCGTAEAADLPTKALAPRVIPLTGCGMYFGVHTSGAAGEVKGSPIAGASIVEGELGAHLGYTCSTDGMGSFWFAEGNIDFTNLNGATQGLSLSGPVDLFQRVGYGTPALATLLTSIPGLNGISTPSLPILPAGVTAGPPVPYLYAGVHEQDVSAQFINPATLAVFSTNKVWEVSPEIGVGFWNRLSNNVVIDVSAGYQIQSAGLCFGAISACPGMGNMWRARVGFNF